MRGSSLQPRKSGVRRTRKLSEHNSGAMSQFSKGRTLKGVKASLTVVRRRGCLDGDIRTNREQVRDVCSIFHV